MTSVTRSVVELQANRHQLLQSAKLIINRLQLCLGFNITKKPITVCISFWLKLISGGLGRSSWTLLSGFSRFRFGRRWEEAVECSRMFTNVFTVETLRKRLFSHPPSQCIFMLLTGLKLHAKCTTFLIYRGAVI